MAGQLLPYRLGGAVRTIPDDFRSRIPASALSLFSGMVCINSCQYTLSFLFLQISGRDFLRFFPFSFDFREKEGIL